MNRRSFLKSLAILSPTFCISDIFLSGPAKLRADFYPENTSEEGLSAIPQNHRMVVINLYGGLDGLAAVTPHKEPWLYKSRPLISCPEPGIPGGLLNLDGTFALHPALKELFPLWQQGSLSFIHGVGAPAANLTHNIAQRFMNTLMPFRAAHPGAQSGWMHRLLEKKDPGPQIRQNKKRPKANRPKNIFALNFGPLAPGPLEGKSLATIVYPENAPKSGAKSQGQKKTIVTTAKTGHDYSSHPLFFLKKARGLSETAPCLDPERNPFSCRSGLHATPLEEGYKLAQERLGDYKASYIKEIKSSGAGRPGVEHLPELCQILSQKLLEQPSIKLCSIGVSGFDTHFDQTPLLHIALEALAKALLVLVGPSSPVRSGLLVVVFSEFGRSIRENVLGGTDNGEAGLVLVAGEATAGGKVYGSLPEINETPAPGIGLPVKINLSQVVAEAARIHFRLGKQTCQDIFPNFYSDSKDLGENFLGFMKV